MTMPWISPAGLLQSGHKFFAFTQCVRVFVIRLQAQRRALSPRAGWPLARVCRGVIGCQPV